MHFQDPKSYNLNSPVYMESFGTKNNNFCGWICHNENSFFKSESNESLFAHQKISKNNKN